MSAAVPGVVDVVPEYRMEEIEVTPGCPGADRPLADVAGSAIVAAVRRPDGELAGSAIVAAVRRPDGELVPQPSGDVVLQPGDVVIAIGTTNTMDRLEALFAPKEAVGSRDAQA